MKTKTKVFFSMLTLGLLFLACNKESDILPPQGDSVEVDPVEEQVELGTISLNAFVKDIIEVSTGKPPTLDEVLDNMTVSIRDFQGNQLLSENYRDLLEFIELASGSYNLNISNYPNTYGRFDVPIYGGPTTRVDVISGENTAVMVRLQLWDVATTINLSEEIKTSYPDITVDASVATDAELVTSTLTWDIEDEGRTGYFLLAESNGVGGTAIDSGRLTVTISATNSSGIAVTTSKSYGTVHPNEHYQITIEKSDDSTISLNITLDDEVVIHDTIPFPN